MIISVFLLDLFHPCYFMFIFEVLASVVETSTSDIINKQNTEAYN